MVKKNGKNWKQSINQSLYHLIRKSGNMIDGRAGAAICFFFKYELKLEIVTVENKLLDVSYFLFSPRHSVLVIKKVFNQYSRHALSNKLKPRPRLRLLCSRPQTWLSK
jgi:hypothetical protein